MKYPFLNSSTNLFVTKAHSGGGRGESGDQDGEAPSGLSRGLSDPSPPDPQATRVSGQRDHSRFVQPQGATAQRFAQRTDNSSGQELGYEVDQEDSQYLEQKRKVKYPGSFLNETYREKKRKSDRAKGDFKKNIKRASALGLVSAVIGIGVFTPYNSAGQTLYSLILSQAPIAIGFSVLGLVLPVVGMVFAGLKAIKNNRDKNLYKKQSEYMGLEIAIQKANPELSKEELKENVNEYLSDIRGGSWQSRVSNSRVNGRER